MTKECKKYLLIDFGASRVKSAFLKGDEILDIQDHEPISPCCTENKKFEVDLNEIKNQFLSIAKKYYSKQKYDGILICSEMHGFAVLNEKNSPVSNYISWKDERCTNEIYEISSLELLKSNLGNSFFEKTGMNARACYPIFNLFHMIRSKEINGHVKIVTLPDWLCCASGKSLNTAHATMSAGLGFYNIYEKTFDEDLINEVSINKVKLSFNKTVENVEAGGYLDIDGKEIPIYTGIGDHQCAVLGAGNDNTTISVNLGTGSQVAIINLANPKCEKRPYFNGQNLSVITHIPSGRVLNTFVAFLKGINSDFDFWKMLDTISLQDIKISTLNINLALFESAWGYEKGGFIENINEGNFNLKNYLASILKCYAEQYVKAIKKLSPGKKYTKIILSGGIPHKLKFLENYLSDATNYDVEIVDSKLDETFAGLKKISELI